MGVFTRKQTHMQLWVLAVKMKTMRFSGLLVFFKATTKTHLFSRDGLKYKMDFCLALTCGLQDSYSSIDNEEKNCNKEVYMHSILLQ